MNFFNMNPLYNNTPQRTPIDPQQFQRGAQSLTKERLSQLVQMARAQGIPESEIETGLNYILNLK